MRTSALIAHSLFLIASALLALEAQAAPKLIFHGWDTLDVTPAEILANADRIATCGSDGLSFAIRTKTAAARS